MKKFVFIFLVLSCAASAVFFGNPATTRTAQAMPSPNVVISQIYGAGGAAGATYTNDYVVLFNRGDAAASLSGWSLQYGSATGTTWFSTTLTAVMLAPGQSYLIQLGTEGANGAALPTPDTASAQISMSRTTGKVALVNNSVMLTGACPLGANVVDFVGYGASPNCFEGTAGAPAPSLTTADFRGANGCTDTDQNSTDFTTATPAPRNTASSVNSCNGTGGGLSGSGAASPSTVAPGQTVLLTVTVTPAQNPPSTGILVTANTEQIGGTNNQTFYDNGTNGDVTAGDNIFSFAAVIPAGLSGGSKIVAAGIVDAQFRAAGATIFLTVNAPFVGDDPLALGNPSNAVTDINQPFNYLIVKPQYSLSYHRDNHTPNWTAHHLSTAWLGTADRQDDYRPDPQVPASWNPVTTSDYSGSGFTRGHMVPSGDRTRTEEDNSATFFMSNFVPQTAQNNNVTWNNLENYLRSLAQSGNELYIFTGGLGSRGTIANGKINVPSDIWKVAIVISNGSNDLQRINKTTRVIAVIAPNNDTVAADWRLYRTSVDKVEALTGLDFFSNLGKNTQYVMERRIDVQP